MDGAIQMAERQPTLAPQPIRRILIVDDSPDIRALLKVVLRRNLGAVEIHEATNGREAMERFADAVPDLVILDLMMPEMDGYEVCRRMRTVAGHLPIIMLSARADAESKQQGFLAGTDDYLVKPCQPRVLLDRVARLLDRAPRSLS